MTARLLSGAKLFGKDVVASMVSRALPRSIMFDKRYFPLWERRGFHVTIDHFYEPVPNSRDLACHNFTQAGDLSGIRFRESEQLALLTSFEHTYREQYSHFPLTGSPDESGFYFGNDTFEEVDAEILYCMVRHFRPARVIEIGSGFSTRLIGQAVSENAALGSAAKEFVAVDPFCACDLQESIPALTAVLRQPVQALDPSYFDRLEAGDILFIDSSHVLKAGSDVQFEFLHVLPRLRPGVVVHVHDVFLPADYPESWLRTKRWFWSEQYLLHAFLSFNDRFRVLWAGHYMHLNHPEALRQAFASYHRQQKAGFRQWPASFWMQRAY